MIYVFHINADDKENEWFPPSDDSGKIYVNARGWTSNPQDSKPKYDQAEHFLQFLESMLVMLYVIITFCNGVNRMGANFFLIK
jgi:hypothetical protein